MLIPLLSYLLLTTSARALVGAPTNCTDSLVWVGSLYEGTRFGSITACLSRRAGGFIHSRLIRCNKAPAWSQHTWRQYATMAVSTHAPFNWRAMCDLMVALQRSLSLHYCPEIHIRDQVGQTMEINANAIQSCTTSSALAMRVRTSSGFRAFTCYCFRLDSSQPFN